MTEDKETWRVIFFAGRKILPVREKRLRARSSGVLVIISMGRKQAMIYSVGQFLWYKSPQADFKLPV